MSIHYYLSPHLDDAALSCSGRMAGQIAAGERVVVVNIFAGIPDYGRLSAYAERQHTKWGRPADPVATRRAEDERVLKRLGAEVVFWAYYDCIYRQVEGEFLYTHHDAVFGQVHPAEYPLVAELAARLTALGQQTPDCRFYAPLAIGSHVDHRLVRTAAIKLLSSSTTPGQVCFYEDFPYVTKPGALAAALAEFDAVWTARLIPIDVETKIKIIAGYQSQLLAVFGEPTAMPGVVRGYAASLSEAGGYYERYWGVRYSSIGDQNGQ